MTDWTYVRLFAGMGAHVNSQRVFVDKRLAALLTFESLLTSVRAQVLLQKGSVHVGLVAQTAAKQFPGVYAHVHAKGAHCRVAATTSVADMGLISCRDGTYRLSVRIWMSFDSVLAQVTAFSEHMMANSAFETLTTSRQRRAVVARM